MRFAALTLIAALIFTPVLILRGQAAQDEGLAFSCGLNATYIFLNRTGHHAPYNELLREFDAQAPPDSLLAIRNVLQENGCATVGVKTDADFFLNHKGPAIVHLQLAGYSPKPESHFSCLIGADRQIGAEFLDPVFNIRVPSFVTWVNFTQSYQGAALILK